MKKGARERDREREKKAKRTGNSEKRMDRQKGEKLSEKKETFLIFSIIFPKRIVFNLQCDIACIYV